MSLAGDDLSMCMGLVWNLDSCEFLFAGDQ